MDRALTPGGDGRESDFSAAQQLGTTRPSEGTQRQNSSPAAVQPPSISLPEGGAIRGIGEKFGETQ